MINIKITSRTTAEDYIAVERETGATVLPGKHVFGIFSIAIISVLLALPFGSLVPESASPFSALTAGRMLQNSKYEKEYLKNDEKIEEQNVEITSTAGSEENFDDDLNTEALIAEKTAETEQDRYEYKYPVSIPEPARKKFEPTQLAKTSTEQNTSDTSKTESEKIIGNIIPSNNLLSPLAQKQDEAPAEHHFVGKWYEQTIRKGDSLFKIFNYLNLDLDDLKLITAAAKGNDLNLSVGSKIQFLIDKKTVVQEIAIPLSGNKQVRFSRDPKNNNYSVNREQRFAQFSHLKSRGMNSSTLIPSFIEAQKKREIKKKEQEALLAEKLKAKEQAEKERLAQQKNIEAKDEKLDEKSKAPIYASHNRPRLIIGSISGKDGFDKTAAKYGLTRSEIVAIKNQYSGKVNFRRLGAGDTFRILFNGIGQGSSMTAISLSSKKYGNITLYRHPQNHIFYEENGYTPSAGAFRRFPITGKIKVNSPFNLTRYHPIRRKIHPHYGVDFKVSIGTPVYAPADGVVTYAKYMRGGGYTIIINHKGGYYTVYMHLSKFDVRQGQNVHIGQVIAKSGNTGYSTGAHLHYEVHVNGRPVDPLKVDLPSGSPATAQRLKETFKNTVYILKSELKKNALASVKN